MGRCKRTRNLEVHHKDRSKGATLSNAEVLCPLCHEATRSYGKPGPTPPPFSKEVKEKALRRAGHRCECTRKSCPHNAL
ncbi:MAG: hypothetical protein DRP90_07840 [Planctomycetota bacterium]|nr:MAG: hypothetical protein DRP90_07840 [Planctomycetota bacterium]